MSKRFKALILLFFSLQLLTGCPKKREVTPSHKKVTPSHKVTSQISETLAPVSKRASTKPSSQSTKQAEKRSLPVRKVQKPKKEFVERWDLSKPQEKALSIWSQAFNRKAYNPCLQRYRIRICCRKGCCEGMFSIVKLTIDAKGSVAKLEYSKPYICNQVRENSISLKRLRRTSSCYLRYIKKSRFLPALKNQKIQLRLGRGYGC